MYACILVALLSQCSHRSTHLLWSRSHVRREDASASWPAWILLRCGRVSSVRVARRGARFAASHSCEHRAPSAFRERAKSEKRSVQHKRSFLKVQNKVLLGAKPHQGWECSWWMAREIHVFAYLPSFIFWHGRRSKLALPIGPHSIRRIWLVTLLYSAFWLRSSKIYAFVIMLSKAAIVLWLCFNTLIIVNLSRYFCLLRHSWHHDIATEAKHITKTQYHETFHPLDLFLRLSFGDHCRWRGCRPGEWSENAYWFRGAWPWPSGGSRRTNAGGSSSWLLQLQVRRTQLRKWKVRQDQVLSKFLGW